MGAVENGQNGPWRIDHRIPIVFLVAVLMQSGAIFYWSGQLNERVASLEKRIVINESDIKATEITQNAMLASISRLEEKTAIAVRVLERIEQKVDRNTRGRVHDESPYYP